MTQFYGALAEWWPVLSPVEDYAEEAAEIRDILLRYRPRARTLLELGSGGGHVAYYLRSHFACCLTDISAGMLAVSRQLNPECEHIEGDMRTLDLGRAFDIVIAHDAIDYMTSEAELARVCDTAWRHLRPGGLVLFLPDAVAETFEPGTEFGGGRNADGRAARLLEWTEDVAPGATQMAVHYSFLLREPDGRVRSVYERHDCGLFPKQTWTRVLMARGFAVDVVIERTSDDRTPRFFFVGHKPGDAARMMAAPTAAEIVRLTAADVGRARELFLLMGTLLDAAAQPLSEDYLERLLRRDDFWVLAASVGGRVVGGLTAHVLPMTRGELAELFVYDLAVAADHRRRGIGRDLVAAVRALAESAGIPVVFVPAGGDDARAAAFYRAVGGTPEAATIFTFGSTSG